MKTTIEADVGVIVGRFQVPNLHKGHIELIDAVTAAHKKVILFIGVSPTKTTITNPLDFESRKQMILSRYPNINVLYVKDNREDKVWSQRLDEQIRDVIGPNQSVILYGSRDSFIRHYTGKFNTAELQPDTIVSGTEIRKDITRTVMNSFEFRAGVIWAMNNQYKKAITTVDIAIMNEADDSVLLVRKPDEKQYRFIGGFSTPESATFEQDACREVMEETGIECSLIGYLGSFKVPDWRYENEVDQIKTLFYLGKYVFGRIEANDDVSEAKWVAIKDLEKNASKMIVPEHIELVKMLLKKLKGST